MIFNSLFFQILLATLGVAIAIVYVQPTFVKIGTIQDAISEYKEERNNVVKVNKKLADLVEKVNAISPDNQRALLRYMPDEIDEVSVARDIYNLSNLANIELTAVTYNERASNIQVTSTGAQDNSHRTLPIQHTFSVAVVGDYNDIKSFLVLLEQSDYPLEVHSLDISSATETKGLVETGMSTSMEIVTYSRI